MVTDPAERKRLHYEIDQPTAERLLRVFQERLRLRDWTLAVDVSRRWSDDAQATVHYRYALRTARITILDPIDWDTPDVKDSVYSQDMLQSMLHELVHLTQFGAKENKKWSHGWFIQEHQCEQIAHALAEGYRNEIIMSETITDLTFRGVRLCGSTSF